jgi:hypothetical protein
MQVFFTDLRVLLIDFLKVRKGALACVPSMQEQKDAFSRVYAVVFDSHAMECESCGRLWKIVN